MALTRYTTLTTILLWFAAALGPWGARALAQSDHRWLSAQLQWENDTLSGTDEHYTNGIRFSWIRNPAVRDNPTWTRRLGTWWCESTPLCVADSPALVTYGHAIGHTFYTPQDITVPTLIRTDRPYAGYLYGSWIVALRNDTAVTFEDTRPIQNQFELQIGMVGPAAFGEEIQSAVHELIGSDEPQGWDHQIDFEPTVELLYRWRRKLGSTRFDLVPHAGAGLGNVMTFAAAGATARLGFNISGFPVNPMVPTAAPTGPEPPEWEAYVFAGAEGRGVARNIFLDGNTFEDSHSVDREPFVYDLTTGASVRWRDWRLTYTFVRRSGEFEGGPGEQEHEFASVGLTYLAWSGS